MTQRAVTVVTSILIAACVSAVVHATGLGVYELRLIGKKVGGHISAPEFTCHGRPTFAVQSGTYRFVSPMK